MTAYIASIPGFGNEWKWISYVPIDRDVLNREWLNALKAPDVLVLYSKFGAEVVKRHLPRLNPEVIYHGVDTDVFRPIDKIEAKREMGLDPTTFIVGYVGRNQIRKRIPRLMQAFKFWNCLAYNENQDVEIKGPHGVELWNAKDYARQVLKMRSEKWTHFKQDPKKFNSGLYLHTTEGYTDNNDGLWLGWHISEYSYRYGLDANPWNKPSRVMLPDQRFVKTISGIPDDKLNVVYNMIDVHVLPSCREGFGLPILESMACGVPNVVTDYSSMPELVEDGRGIKVPVTEFDEEPFYDAPSALVSIEGIVDALNKCVEMYNSGEMRDVALNCRRFALENDWKSVFKKFHTLTRELLR